MDRPDWLLSGRWRRPRRRRHPPAPLQTARASPASPASPAANLCSERGGRGPRSAGRPRPGRDCRGLCWRRSVLQEAPRAREPPKPGGAPPKQVRGAAQAHCSAAPARPPPGVGGSLAGTLRRSRSRLPRARSLHLSSRRSSRKTPPALREEPGTGGRRGCPAPTPARGPAGPETSPTWGTVRQPGPSWALPLRPWDACL